MLNGRLHINCPLLSSDFWRERALSAMTSLCHLTSRAFPDVAPRRFLSASFSRSAVLSSTALSAKSFDSPNISDIFDAPVRLAERPTPVERLSTFYIPSAARLTWRAVPSHPKTLDKDAWALPWSLPPPVTFDGPACPPHMSASTLESRRLQRARSSLRARNAASAVSCSAFLSTSEPIYRLFDGPSRVTRYRYPSPRDEGYSFTYISLGLGLSSAFCWFILNDDLDLMPVSLTSG